MNNKPSNPTNPGSLATSADPVAALLNAADKPVRKEGLKQHLMDSNEVLILLSICRVTLYNWRRKGFIRFSKIGGRTYFEVSDVYQMLKKLKKNGRAARA
jgi:hypothetical protein